jgi:hypothetical protein
MLDHIEAQMRSSDDPDATMVAVRDQFVGDSAKFRDVLAQRPPADCRLERGPLLGRWTFCVGRTAARRVVMLDHPERHPVRSSMSWAKLTLSQVPNPSSSPTGCSPSAARCTASPSVDKRADGVTAVPAYGRCRTEQNYRTTGPNHGRRLGRSRSERHERACLCVFRRSSCSLSSVRKDSESR